MIKCLFSKLSFLFPCDTFSLSTGCSLGYGITPHHHHQLAIALRSPRNFHIHHHHIDRHDNQMIIITIVIVIKVAARWVAGVRPPGCPQSSQPSRVIDIVIVIINTISIYFLLIFTKDTVIPKAPKTPPPSSSCSMIIILMMIFLFSTIEILPPQKLLENDKFVWQQVINLNIWSKYRSSFSLNHLWTTIYIWNVGSWSWQ